MQLDPAGTAIMEQALLGEMAPILVVYQLDYVALRPAFSVRLKIDWDRVQEALDEEYGHEGMFTSTQIGKSVDKLRETRAIEFTADNFVADAPDAASPETARFNAARARVEEMITDAFFESSLPPMTTRPDGWDRAADILGEAHQKAMQASLGPIAATIGTFTYKKQTRDRIDRKRLDVEISERSAVLRSSYPQGHVSGLFRPLRDGDNPKRYIRRSTRTTPSSSAAGSASPIAARWSATASTAWRSACATARTRRSWCCARPARSSSSNGPPPSRTAGCARRSRPSSP
ncbi:hypothetical protein ACFQU2_35430 [Siccirubricoccus deserti]